MNRSGTPGQNRPTLNSSASTSSADNNSNNNNNDSAYKAALKGASLAFQNTGSKGQSPAPPQGRSIDNRALIAATSTAHQYGLSPSRSPPRTKPPGISRQTTGSSARSAGTSGYDIEHGAIVQKLQQLSPQSAQRQGGHAATQLLMPPGKHTTTPDAKSPSFIAATLAASRSGSPSPRQPVQPHPYQQTVRRQQGGNTGTTHSAATSVTSLDLAADAVPLPSTNALISMFEKRDDDTDPVKKQTATPSSSNKPPVSKPKPKPKPRPVTPPGALNVVTKSSIKPPEILASPPARERPVSSPAPARGPAGEKHEPQREPTGLESKRPPPTPPPPRSTKNEVEESPSTRAALPKRKARASTPPRSVANADTVILSPQPRRASSQKILSRRSSEDDMTLASQPKGPPAVKPKPQHRASSAQYGKKSSSAPLKESPRPITLAEKERRPTSSSSEDTFVSASSAPSPPPEPPRRRGIQPSTPDPPRAARPASTQSTPASARSQGRLLAPPPPLPQRQQQQQQTTGIPLDSLANAIVAGSLASSRHTPTAASTSNSKKQPPSPPPTRKQTPLRMRQTLRQPPPANKSDDEDAAHNKHRHRKKPFGKSNKHSHHEGQRKRWREEITPRERKRYEGVWASNRGLLLLGGGGGGGGGGDKKTGTGVLPRQYPSSLSSSPANGRVPNQNLSPSQNRDQKRPSLGAASTSFSATPPEERLGIAGDDTAMTTATATTTNTGDLVANVVVRDLWARSRLPPDELAEVWDLVDGRGRGALDRAEFVVGMWLVDQRLRGRKIPRKVSESVWASARGAGVRVRVKGAKKGR